MGHMAMLAVDFRKEQKQGEKGKKRKKEEEEEIGLRRKEMRKSKEKDREIGLGPNSKPWAFTTIAHSH